MSIEKNGVSLHDLREAKVYMARVEDQRHGHRWLLVAEAITPPEASRDGKNVSLRYFIAAGKEDEAVKLVPHKSSTLGQLLERWKTEETSGDATESGLMWDPKPQAKQIVQVETKAGTHTAPVGEVTSRFIQDMGGGPEEFSPAV